jgi:5,5'-dehydrodivanillate O-demethylase
MVARVMQGPISDRENDNLSASDKGVILCYKMLDEEMDKVSRGKDPLGTIRDRALNEPMINLHREAKALTPFDSKYETTFDRVIEKTAG